MAIHCFKDENVKHCVNSFYSRFNLKDEVQWNKIFGHDPIINPLGSIAKKRISYYTQNKRMKSSNANIDENRVRKSPRNSTDKLKRKTKKKKVVKKKM